MALSSEKELNLLIQASREQSIDQIPETNFYRKIGFEEESARLGWVIPPVWQDVEVILEEFLRLNVVQGKTHFVFSGMGGSINTIKALIQILEDECKIKLHTIDNLDPDALKELLSTVDSPSQTLVIGISKSGTTRETQDLLKTLREEFRAENLDYQNHFLWLTDLPQGRRMIEKTGWKTVEILPIQVDRSTDIGGRFTAPHTLIFLIPLLLLLNKDLNRLKALWHEYLSLKEKFIIESARKACELANKDVEKFAIILEEKLSQALETWIIQLFQESLGSKVTSFNPKTFVVPSGAVPSGFEAIRFDISSSDIIEAMLNMYLLQVFVAIFSYYKGINFVTQPEVEIYKGRMKEISSKKIPQAEKVTITELIERIRKKFQNKPQVKFLEAVCYWHLREEKRNYLRQTLKEIFPDKEVHIFVGSDWNHHSYQAASWNEDTFFIILTKHDYEQQIEGISGRTLKENIDTLKTIAYATYETLKDKAEYFELTDD